MIAPLSAADFKIVINPNFVDENYQNAAHAEESAGASQEFNAQTGQMKLIYNQLTNQQIILSTISVLCLLLYYVSGSRSHEALVPVGLHGPAIFSLDPSPNYPAASLTHSGRFMSVIISRPNRSSGCYP
jgi:hypothetical protein